MEACIRTLKKLKHCKTAKFNLSPLHIEARHTLARMGSARSAVCIYKLRCRQKGLNGSIGTRLFDSLKKNQLKGLAYWTNGFKQITTNQGPVKTPDDLKGQDLRIMQSDVIEDQFKPLGATPHQESFNSTFQLLEKM